MSPLRIPYRISTTISILVILGILLSTACQRQENAPQTSTSPAPAPAPAPVSMSPLATPKPIEPSSLVVANFDVNLEGFVGNGEFVPTGGRDNSGCLRMVNPDRKWVEIAKRFAALEHDIAELHILASSTTAKRLAIRLTDATGQAFQYRLPLTADGGWHDVHLARGAAKASEVWGGAKDRKWHGPITEIRIILEGAGTEVRVDSITAVLERDRFVPELRVSMGRPGNVFLADEVVEIPTESRASTISWSVVDAWGATQATGKESVANGRAVIRPPSSCNGYFTISLTACNGDEVIARRYSTYAIIPPIDPQTARGLPYGTMTHFQQGWDTDLLPILLRAGITTVRDEQDWATVEPNPGVYSFPERFTKYMAECERLGIEPLIEMTFGNRHYDGGHAPVTDEGRAAYARYGEALLSRYGRQIDTLEIWNEYNGTWCGGEAERDRPRYYTEMLRVAYERIKALRPNLRVLGGAAVLIPIPYFEQLFAHGALRFMDAVVIHPYRAQPEGVEQEVAELQSLIRAHNNGVDKPIWVTETGATPRPEEWPWERGCDLWDKARFRTAEYLIRQYALLLSTGTVERIFWYLARDDASFRLMGLLRSPDDAAGRYAVTAPYVAYATLIRQLGRCRPLGRASTASSTYVIAFRRDDGDEIRVCWSTQPAAIEFVTDKPITATDFMGVAETLTPMDGRVFLGLGSTPLFIRGAVTAVSEGARLEIAGRQKVALLDDFALAYRWNGQPFAGEVVAGRQTIPLISTDGRAVISGISTKAPSNDIVRYKVRSDGRTVGIGTVDIEIADPLVWRDAPVFVAASTLGIGVINPSSTVDFHATGLEYSLDGQNRAVTLTSILPKCGSLEFALPTQMVTPFRDVDIRYNLKMDGRDQLQGRAKSSWNPCVKSQAKMDGSLYEWRSLPAIDIGGGRIWPGWDDDGIILAADIPDGNALQFACASGGPGPWRERNLLADWFEAKIGVDGRLTALQVPRENASPTVEMQVKDGRRQLEIRIPWLLIGETPSIGKNVRLALVVGDGPTRATWGGGIVDGRNPDDFKICRLIGGSVAQDIPLVQPGSAMSATAAPRLLLADSLDGYSKLQSAAGWTYGIYDGTGSGDGDGHPPLGGYTDDDFKPMDIRQTVWGYDWRADAPFCFLGPRGGHPGLVNARAVWAVRRWTSTVAGRVRLLSTASRPEKRGDGSGIIIIVDGVQVLKGLLSGGDTQTIDVTVPVRVGSRLDFAITPGPEMRDLDFDGVDMHIGIWRASP